MKLSKVISTILHPIFMPIIALYISLKLIPSIGFSITNYLSFIYTVMIISTIVLPLITILFMIKKNEISSLEMSDNKERSTPLIATAIWMVIGYLIIENILVFSPLLKAEIIGAIGIIFVGSIVSKYWKISLHMLGVGGVVGVLMSLNFIFGGLIEIIIVSIIISGILGAARLREKAHNSTQIYIGFIVGLVIESSCLLLY